MKRQRRRKQRARAAKDRAIGIELREARALLRHRLRQVKDALEGLQVLEDELLERWTWWTAQGVESQGPPG